MPMAGIWAHAGTSVLAAFLASLVECVEALTVVLAVGTVRGWRSALAGAGMAVLVLALLVAAIGPALSLMPIRLLQLSVGALSLLFALRWLRKAILRAAGLLPLHDEAAAFRKNEATLRAGSFTLGSFDRAGVATAFNIVMLEGTEVVFIVLAVGAGGARMLLPASLGAAAALVVVVLLGLLLHRPLARVPENLLKFAVGVLLSAFGTFWVGEGLGLGWPGEDWAIGGLLLGYLAVALLMVALCRAPRRTERSQTG